MRSTVSRAPRRSSDCARPRSPYGARSPVAPDTVPSPRRAFVSAPGREVRSSWHDELKGKKIAILATEGVEQVELTEPRKALEEAGATHGADLAREGRDPGLRPPRQGRHASRSTARVDETSSATTTTASLLPGGVANPDHLRAARRRGGVRARVLRRAASRSPRSATRRGCSSRPTSCEGRTITSWPSLQTDVRNAGGTWVDEEVHVDEGLVTSRKPDDLPAFNAKTIEEFAEGKHADAPQPA